MFMFPAVYTARVLLWNIAPTVVNADLSSLCPPFPRPASMMGHLEVATLLIRTGNANLEAANRHSFTPLHTSAQHGQWRVVQMMIAAGAKVNSQLPDGATPLYLASERGNTGAVRALCRAKADALLSSMVPCRAKAYMQLSSMGTWPEPQVPLDIAAFAGHSGVVRELLESGGKRSCGGASEGVDALRNAAENGHVNILVMLAEAGVVDNGTALLLAACSGATESVKFLLQQHSSRGSASSTKEQTYVDTLRFSGRTPLICNIMFPHCSPRMVRLLVDAGADLTLASPRDGTPLALAWTQLRMKMIHVQPATEEQLNRLEAIRRLLLRVDAVYAASWLWTSGDEHLRNNALAVEGGDGNSTAPSAQLASMLPIMRWRAARRGVLLSAMFRWAGLVRAVTVRRWALCGDERLLAAGFGAGNHIWLGTDSPLLAAPVASSSAVHHKSVVILSSLGAG